MWSYGFAGAVGVFGGEMKGWCRRVAAVFGVRMGGVLVSASDDEGFSG